MFKKVISQVSIIFLYALSLLPMPILHVLGSFSYIIVYYVLGYRKKVVTLNLVNSFPDKKAEDIKKIEKRFYKYLTSLIFEIIKLSTISKEELQRRFKFKNIELINSYLDNGKSVLVCSAHYGNWEWGTVAAGLSLKGVSYPIYKPLSNKVFDKWFNTIRSRFGNRMVSMRQTYRALTESKDEATVFYFGSDQAPPKLKSHYWVEFLHQPTSIPMGVEKIAVKTKRPVFYLKVKVIKKGYYEVDCLPLCLHPEESTGHEITNLHARILEETIQNDPAYWLWSHKRWKHKPNQ